MARLSPETYAPILQFRFQIIFSNLENIKIYGKAASLPNVQNNPITVEYGNTYLKVKGKTRWDDVEFTCYAYEGITYEELWDYLNKLHQEISTGKDRYGETYKKDIQILLMSPTTDVVIGKWKLIGAFLSSLNFGELDWGSDEVVQPRITIAYDYAEYSSQFQQDAGTPAPDGPQGPIA